MKGPGKGSKQRLASALSATAREALSRAMLEDVLEQLACLSVLDGILLVSGDSDLQALEACYPVTFFPEPADNSEGLNGAVTAAAQHLAKLGVGTALVVHGDLPLLDPDELERLLLHHGVDGETPRVTLVPDDQGSGTNALVVTPPLALPFSYGCNSLKHHCQLAEEQKLAVTIFSSKTLALDIDTPGDLHCLASYCDADPALRQRRSCRLLENLNLWPLCPPMSASNPPLL